MKLPAFVTRSSVAFAAAAGAVGIGAGTLIGAGVTTTNTGAIYSVIDGQGRPFAIDLREVQAVYVGNGPGTAADGSATPDTRQLVDFVIRGKTDADSIIQVDAGTPESAAAIVAKVSAQLGPETKPLVVTTIPLPTTAPKPTTTLPPPAPSST